jgi:hypothetical protein
MTWTAITGTIDLDTIFNEVVLATEDDGGIVHVIDKGALSPAQDWYWERSLDAT